MKINESETRGRYPLSSRKIIKKTLGSGLGWAVLGIMGIGALLVVKIGANVDSQMESDLEGILPYLNPTIILIFFFTVFAVVLTYLYQRWYFAVYYYELADHYISIKKGPITPREINVPYERFQDVYVDQDIFDRIFGLYDVHISSATITSGMEAHIDGLGKEAANGLRDHILDIIKKKISGAQEGK